MNKRVVAWLLLACLIIGVAPAQASFSKPRARDMIDSSKSISRMIDVPGRGEMHYYAQNDPTWALMTYRFPHQTNEPRFSGAGCIPTAVAMCIANLVPAERLPLMHQYTWQLGGVQICPCSMNRFDCDNTHYRFQLRTAQEFQQFFCLAVGSYFSGNNPSQAYAAGSFYLVPDLLKKYGLSYKETDNLRTAITEVQRKGALAVALVAGEDCPFTTGSHALVLASVEGNTCYFLDSFHRKQDEYYRRGPAGMIEVVEPGLVTMHRKWADRLGAYQIYIVYPPAK